MILRRNTEHSVVNVHTDKKLNATGQEAEKIFFYRT